MSGVVDRPGRLRPIDQVRDKNYTRNQIITNMHTEKKEQKLRRENKGPVRRLKTAERHRDVTFKPSKMGNTVSRHLQGDQSAARAAAATSKNLLEAVMEANRRRSFSISFIRRNTDNSSQGSSSGSCIDQSATGNGTVVPLAELMSKPALPQPEPDPEPPSTLINQLRPESEMIFRAYGLSNRSISMPPMKAPQRPNAYIEPPPRNQQSSGTPTQTFKPLQMPSNKKKFDFGDGGLMIVDAKLKEQLVMGIKSQPAKGVQFGFDPIDGVRFESVPVAYAFRSEKAHIQKEVKEQIRLRSLGDRIRQFQCIQFADGPVSNVNFNRRAQQQQKRQQQQRHNIHGKRCSLGVKVSLTKAPRSNPSMTSCKSIVSKSRTSGGATIQKVTRAQTSQAMTLVTKAKADTVKPHIDHCSEVSYDAVTGLALSWPRTALEQFKNSGIPYDVTTKSMPTQNNIKLSLPSNAVDHVKLLSKQRVVQQHKERQQINQQVRAKINNNSDSLLMSERQMNNLCDDVKNPVARSPFRVSLLSNHYRSMPINSNWTCMPTTNSSKHRTQQSYLSIAGKSTEKNATNESNNNSFLNATTNITTNGTNKTSLPRFSSRSLSHAKSHSSSIDGGPYDNHQNLKSSALDATTTKQHGKPNVAQKACNKTKSEELVDESKFNFTHMERDLCGRWSRNDELSNGARRKTQAQQSPMANAIAITQRVAEGGQRKTPTITRNQTNFSLAIEKFRQQRQQRQQKLQESNHQLQQQQQQHLQNKLRQRHRNLSLPMIKQGSDTNASQERHQKQKQQQQTQTQQQQRPQQTQQTKQEAHAVQMSMCAKKKTNNNKSRIYQSLQQQRKMSPTYQQCNNGTDSTCIATSPTAVVATSDNGGGGVVADGSSSGDNGRVVSHHHVTTTNTLPEPTANATTTVAAAAPTTTTTTKTTAALLTASTPMSTTSTSNRHEVQRQYHYQSQKTAQFVYCMRIKPN